MNKRIVVLAPHTDDGEVGAGGTITRMIEENADIYYIAFSCAEASIPKEWPSNQLRKEVREATKVLGIEERNLILKGYSVRCFPDYRQEILEDMIKLDRELKPDIVLMPSTYDTHQDHKVISEEGFRAFKKRSIWGYEFPWNNLTFSTTGFVILNEEYMKKKIKAYECYESQSFRNEDAERIRSLAIVRGQQVDAQYAEAFEIIRLVMK